MTKSDYFSAGCIVLLLATKANIGMCADVEPSRIESRPNIFFFFADDWGRYASSYNTSSPNPNGIINTPSVDRVAQCGVKFNNAHVNSPSSTPCRSALLSGQYFYRTGLGAILQGAEWDLNIPSYPLLLEQAGYHIGYTYKVWLPGKNIDAPYGGKAREYASHGRRFNDFSQSVTKMVNSGSTVEQAKTEIYSEVLQNFDSFMADRKPGSPFCYWFGPTNTHRKWTKGSGKALWGLNPDDLTGRMPAFIPDVPEIREDMCDYLGEVLALDQVLGLLIERLKAIGELDNTIIVISGDHGIPGFPRAKCNLYPLGTAVPLIVQWPAQVKGNRTVDDFINLIDLAPTFLEVGGVETPECMNGRSILPLLKSSKQGQIDPTRDYVVTGRERHVANARDENMPYPQRAIQTKDFIYIRNFAPNRYPIGMPVKLSTTSIEPTLKELENNTSVAYGDFDASPTKAWLVKHRDDNKWAMHWELGFEKRPAEELYDLHKDPDYLHNVADRADYAKIKAQLSERLMNVLTTTGDPRVTGDGQTFDRSPYTNEFIK